ncbi:MAG: hypothetical protein H0T52_08230 [Lautropia sp.]|nr:hypothetical protein [Lautropia sp.]
MPREMGPVADQDISLHIRAIDVCASAIGHRRRQLGARPDDVEHRRTRVGAVQGLVNVFRPWLTEDKHPVVAPDEFPELVRLVLYRQRRRTGDKGAGRRNTTPIAMAKSIA